MRHLFDIVRNPNEAEKIGREAERAIWTLAQLSEDNDAEAADELFRTTAFATQILTQLCEARPELFSRVAADQIAWPVFDSLHAGFSERNP